MAAREAALDKKALEIKRRDEVVGRREQHVDPQFREAEELKRQAAEAYAQAERMKAEAAARLERIKAAAA